MVRHGNLHGCTRCRPVDIDKVSDRSLCGFRHQRGSRALGTPAPRTMVCAVAGGLKPQVPSLPNPASPEVKQAASQAVDAVKVGAGTECSTSRLQQAIGVDLE